MKREWPVSVHVLCLILAIPAVIWTAFVFTILWGWFLVPLGVPTIGKAHAWGLLIFVGMFLAHGKPRTEDSVELVLYYYLVPTMAVGFGWGAHSLMG